MDTLRYTFRYGEKLHLHKDFQRVFKTGRRMVHPAIFIYIGARPEQGPLRRLGLVTSRKVGTAVERNTVKRRLREIFRLHKHELAPGTDMIFVLRPPAVKLNYAELEAVVIKLWHAAKVVASA